MPKPGHSRGLKCGFPAFFSWASPIGLLLYLLDITQHLFDTQLFQSQYYSYFFICLLGGIYTLYPAHRGASRAHVAWYDWVAILAAFYIFGSSAIWYEDMSILTGFAPTNQAIMGLLAVFLVLEAVRRILGPVLVILALVFILYGHFAYMVPGVFQSNGLSWGRLLNFLYLDANALNGVPTSVASTMVAGFLFFGCTLYAAGGGQFLADLSLCLMGHQRGGAAKVTIIASALFGSLSGSASANVAVCGTVTIPLMVRTGYTPPFAAAIEAAASTGGLFMPPVMGITAFMMAEFLQIPYYKVAIAAIIPAVSYYYGLYLLIHFEAIRTGITGLPRADLPKVREVLKRGWIFIIPVAALLYFLFGMMMDPARSALYSGVIMLLCGLINREVRRNFARVFGNTLVDAGRQTLLVGAACATAGLVIGSIFATNLGLSFSSALVELSGGNTFLLLVLAGIGAIILGMGMPIAATYTMLAVLVVPALGEIGIYPVAAHMFLNFFAAMSFVTPPVCIAAFVAAGIAKCSPMACGWQATRLGFTAYIVPFAFCYNMALLMQGDSVIAIISATVFMLIGVAAMACAVAGWLIRNIGWMRRFYLGVAGLLLLSPRYDLRVIALAAMAALIFFLIFTKKKAPANLTPTA